MRRYSSGWDEDKEKKDEAGVTETRSDLSRSEIEEVRTD